MGGGAAIRSATKVAGGFNGLSSQVAEHSLRNAARHVPEALSSPPPLLAMAGDVAPVYSSAPWDLDDWVVANVDNTEPNAERVVFGTVPSFEEAKAAASELKSAVEKIYLCGSCSRSECSSPHSGSQASWASPHINDNHSYVNHETTISFPSVPINAFHQAFHLLSSNPEAHNVVASIASDFNVWNAVMQNPALKDFFKSSLYEAGVEEGLTHNEETEKLPDSDLGNVLVDYMSTMLNKASITVAEMVTSMSSYVKNTFRPISDEKSCDHAFGITTTTTTTAKGNNFMNPTVTMGGTFMGLAMLVMIVVLLKRA
ncbi:uncharacterized protein LOC107614207 isoform X2 [Arachis ipaensis]|uniref:uncharacterized protein LOC107614207 isoform X2 n=1 Tax=Arachis ipaensis TaxID=130454 RepID=UPI0007AFAE8C|nr:uncharacterized protein LOC107614207 isoform X2 [Arachis ipaensis]XP_025672259.1 uncharacterized protein LOC112771672 [Arachis hypogaea]QHN95881.1 uncharacterized protein DS421_18g613560 [Arachis hypogaea]